MNLAEKRNHYSRNYGLILEDEALNFQAFSWQGLDICLLMVFSGKAAKPKAHIKFKGFDALKQATEYAGHLLEEVRVKKQAAKAQRLLKAENHVVALDIGDVLVSSWGYDQTNINYYQVTRLVGKKSVAVREIDKHSIESAIGMTGTCTPLPYQFISEPFSRRVLEGRTIKICSSQYATLKPFTLLDEKRVYKADQWTAYA